MPDDALIVCENLVKIYRVANLEVVALQGLDLVVPRGEILGLVGPSGSGKSSLLNLLGGLDRPTAGRVWVNGLDLLKLAGARLDRYRRQTVGFLWQQSARNLIPHLTVLENVLLPLALIGQGGATARRRAEALLQAVGLSERRRHRPAQLSGGEQQRVALAVALANQPPLLLADEPTGEVDAANALAIYQTLRRLNREFGVTIVIVSHDPQVARHVDRVVAIRDGKTATEIIHHPATATGHGATGGREGRGALEEWVLVDSAGRLQIPREQLERFAIGGRVRLETTEAGLLIRPAPLAATRAAATRQAGADAATSGGARRWAGTCTRPVPGPCARLAGTVAGVSHANGRGPSLVIDAERLTRIYRSGAQTVEALRQVDLCVAAGRFIALQGPSGSGKTTLLNCLGGLDQPTAGRVRVFGEDLGVLDDAQRTRWRRERLGFVFQSFSLLPTLSAYENVELVLRLAQRGRRERHEQTLRCLALVDLEKWRHHRPFELSGGQQQRLAVARALANAPRLILADEPTGELDSATARDLLALLRRMVDADRVTILMTSHDPLAGEYVDETFRLQDGQIVAPGVRE